MKIITVTNQKGGVGKTTTVITLAHGLARAGKRALIVDLDPQGQCAVALNIPQESAVFNLLVSEMPARNFVRETGRERLQIVPGNKKTTVVQATYVVDPHSYPLDAIATALKPLADFYDYILLDTSPSVGGLQERAIWAANYVVIPVSTEFLSLQSLGETMSTINTFLERGWKGKLLGILPTHYDQVTRECQKAIAYLTENFAKSVLTPIRRATILRDCASEGITIWEKQREESIGYTALVDTVIKVAR